VKVIIGDAVDILTTRIAPQSVDQILIFFPDPWPKKRHHKRRLLNADFLHTLVNCLKPCGLIHIATDWKDYAISIVGLIRNEPLLHNTAEDGFSLRPASRPETKYERRGVRLGYTIYDIIASRNP
jgi:tRNA (guanine-N7-)-methyltransferase